MEVDAAVFGKELAAVQYRDLEEQNFRAMLALFAQQQRACIARLAGERLPERINVPTVQSYRLRPERVGTYINSLLQSLPYAIGHAAARENITARINGLRRYSVARIRDLEPQTARRRIG